jgi:hypothetical protein
MLERIRILNLSMHFRDKSKKMKTFGGLGNFPDLDAHSMTTSKYDCITHDERMWILNLDALLRQVEAGKVLCDVP